MKSKTFLKKALKASLEAAKQAGAKQVKYQKRLDKLDITAKEALGVVSNADIESEKLIIDLLKKDFPDSSFLAEESYYKKYNNSTEAYDHFKDVEWLWIIDPLDGTNNFVNGLDYFSICISLVHNGKVVMGLVYRPTNGDLFYALEGEKTRFQNLKEAKRAKTIFDTKVNKSLKQSLLVTGFATEKGEAFDREFDLFIKIMKSSRGIRRMGSAALDMCYVAQGTFTGFWERGLAPWDVAAAGFICIQAGVKVTDYNGQKFNPFNETIVTARTPVHGQLKKLF